MIASRLRDGVIIVAVFLLIAFVHHIRSAHAQPIHTGETLGALSLTRFDGTPAALAPRAGHPLLLVVFTTWCPSCRAELPVLRRLAGSFAQSGVDVVAIDQAESGTEVQRFTQAYGLPYAVYLDESGITKRSLGARIIPTTVAVDRKGIVRAVHAGPLDRDSLLALAKIVS